MATSEGRPTFLEGWTNWQIGLAVGAPIALGLAGLWYYKRSKQQSPKSNDETETKAAASPTKEKVAENTPLEKAQAAKNKGNKYFKGGKYDEAIKCYTQALEICPSEHKQEISTFYANRAAAYEKLKNHQAVVENCSEAIKLNNKYIKALTRRATAAEHLGNLTMALEDVTAVCILEGFQNGMTLQTADRVLKDLGKSKAKEALKSKRPSMPSKQYIRNYFKAFTQDPVQKCFLSETGLEEVHSVKEKIPDLPEEETLGRTQDSPSRTQESLSRTQETVERSQPDVLSRTQEKENQSDLIQNQSENNSNISLEQSKEIKRNEEVNHHGHIPAQECPFRTAVEKLRSEKYDEIILLCTSEIEQTPPSRYQHLALLLRGTMYSLMNQLDYALTDLNSLLNVQDLDKKIRVNALIKRGTIYIQQEKQTEGLADFAQAARIDQDNSDIYHHRGHQNIQLDRLDDATRDFENSISKNPKFSTSYIQKSYAEHRKAAVEQSTTKLEKAIESYEKTLKMFPHCADGHALYAQALCDLGRFEDADNEFETAIKLEPDNANTLVHRALLKIQWKQDLHEPVALIKQAIDIDNKCEYAYEILGTIEVQRGDMVKAVELFNKAIGLCRTEAELSHLFSLLHAAQAQLKAAQTLGIPLPANFTPMP